MFNRENYPSRHTARLIDQIDEMLKHPEFLEDREHAWVQKIDKTVANFASARMTPRQEEVIRDIYTKFVARRKSHAKDIPMSAPTSSKKLLTVCRICHINVQEDLLQTHVKKAHAFEFVRCPACGYDVKAQNLERHYTGRCPVTKQKPQFASAPQVSISTALEPSLSKSLGYIMREVAAQQASASSASSATSSHRKISSQERSRPLHYRTLFQH